jgi:hypothetical protein
LPDLFRFLFILPEEEWPLEYWYRPCDTIPYISKLRRAGIKVNPRKKDNFLIVDFQNGVIEMPTIILNDLMCTFLVNCVAFEQCYKKSSKNFSVYALFLDCLVNTAGDVEYLCDHRVIENYIENEAANFINNLGKGLTFDLNYVDFFVLCKRVNKYYKNSLYRQWTNFTDDRVYSQAVVVDFRIGCPCTLSAYFFADLLHRDGARKFYRRGPKQFFIFLQTCNAMVLFSFLFFFFIFFQSLVLKYNE